ncbi:MAG: glycosyltransferase family 39 protein, partial [Lachnospiraceae bacterium]|nr:glycosyltransferase family 39 protein [Lachnospiraceae bacterium]
MKKNKDDIICTLTISISWLVRLIYVLTTSVGERQHDLGYATLLSDGQVNPGHLGYVEYIAKFHHLPDFDPFSIFSYYHPPVHHIIAGTVVDIAHRLGINEPYVYEFIQIPTCIYGCVTVFIAYKILKLICRNSRYICIPLALIAFHPGLIYMCGTVNNDMLAAMMSFICIYNSLLWISRGHRIKELIYMALSIGIGLISKLNVAVLIFPMGIIMLSYFIDCIKNGLLIKCIKQYVLFGLISFPI